ncbi:uncharacterized protein ATNIH1004_003209 [Aspergillus tanneri]|uniref:Uncharacterized protein n=1 Tax=Aspergillus tanneri TaxID=1220188 RepID=A0A5M9MTS2_9EURO|nr:uncharacterized protein ATNIH1004_003209 [Aspergillus tanneri]KAA8650522.1 hypothetical protein ATNIH1004_003209 [Aspergillus tanneri]
MATESSPVPTSSPRPRPRTATGTHPTTTSSSASSRRPSQVMGPPSIPFSMSDPESVRAASGPLRHPKPLTPSDLHSMLEKEQEAMVNRLSRELSLLRQQTASVASTASSASTSFNDPMDTLYSPYLINTAHPTASRRHRSSSSLSSSYVPAVQGSRTGSVTGIAPSRDVSVTSPRPGDSMRSGRSREPSLTSPRPSDGALSLPPSSQQIPYQSIDQLSHPPGAPSNAHRSSLSQQQSRTFSSTSRPDEIAHQRAELELIRRENEAFRRRVRELESTLKKYREEVPTAPSAMNALTDSLRKASLTEDDNGK